MEQFGVIAQAVFTIRSITHNFLLLININVLVDYLGHPLTVVISHDHRAGSPMPKLTKRTIDAAELLEIGYFIWDDGIPGVGVRVMPSGRKSFVVQYRAGRRPRRTSLGPSTVLTGDQARTRAITILSAVRNGEDPAAERDAGRKAITIKELAERFDKEHIAIRVKASTGKEYRRNLQRFILPALGQLTVTGVTRADIARFHHELRHIPYQANRCLEVISKMFVLAEMWGLCPDGSNPRKHIRKFPRKSASGFSVPPSCGGSAKCCGKWITRALNCLPPFWRLGC
jgi:hypothetical protein